jgi:hypothetical protein
MTCLNLFIGKILLHEENWKHEEHGGQIRNNNVETGSMNKAHQGIETKPR